MSQLTEEQVKAINDVLIATGEDQFEIGFFISRVQEKLKPLPSYGEVSYIAYQSVKRSKRIEVDLHESRQKYIDITVSHKRLNLKIKELEQ